eukprot:CAMPEP_0170537478 /NCGR_PEP_ID=MMETSP0209-20121228/102739_1 /TAXON_ID=665100 ORGANISM="Litonotus pictus, Strain P1" /NCGR_SAMPLE_ID=MMETSP0209 /ASSEMBLY_ACC=CAM_ASM_000301 /LENGTH=268 /DNA_ID=CAMNT_0010838983 /DNA_START=201 /DNA_END=1004 /DNA_ORIENTATION=-
MTMVEPEDENELIVPMVNAVKYMMKAALAAGVKRVVYTSFKGCTYVFHVASTMTMVEPEDENELIVPMVNAVKYMMKAALAAGVKRVVYTSSTGCVYTRDGTPTVDESNWPDKYNGALCKGNNLEEKTIWEFHEQNKGKIEVVALNISFIAGPPLSTKGFLTGDVIKGILMGASPENPFFSINWVDVREVAQAHIKALEAKDGNRYIIAGENKRVNEVAEMLKEDWGKHGYNVTTKESTTEIPQSKKQDALNEKSIREMGMKYRPLRE